MLACTTRAVTWSALLAGASIVLGTTVARPPGGTPVDVIVTGDPALLAGAMGRPGLRPEITGKARAGDIRHCIPDLAKAREELGLGAPRDFAQGLAELAEWVARQQAEDRVAQARRELEARGLVA